MKLTKKLLRKMILQEMWDDSEGKLYDTEELPFVGGEEHPLISKEEPDESQEYMTDDDMFRLWVKNYSKSQEERERPRGSGRYRTANGQREREHLSQDEIDALLQGWNQAAVQGRRSYKD